MDRERIKSVALRLPIIPSLKEPVGGEAWEGDENGAHFIFTRNKLPIVDHVSMYSLSLSGNELGKASLRNDFVNTLGKPDSEHGMELSVPVHFVSWLAPNVARYLED